MSDRRERAAYWLVHARELGTSDPVELAAKNIAHEVAMDAGYPDDFGAAQAVALAVLEVARVETAEPDAARRELFELAEEAIQYVPPYLREKLDMDARLAAARTDDEETGTK